MTNCHIDPTTIIDNRGSTETLNYVETSVEASPIFDMIDSDIGVFDSINFNPKDEAIFF